MSKAKKTNIPVSIKTRLLNLSRESRLDYMKLLVRYLQERLLYRISMSAYREHLLLKGSALLYAYGFGDVVTPGPHQLDYPVLLDEMPRPTLMAYSLESSIAEKFHAMIERDSQNSRMKDFFDVYMILTHYEVDLEVLAEAIRNTFRRRETRYTPYAALFADGFATEAGRVQQWRAFLKRIRWPEEIDFAEVVTCICEHIGPCWDERNIDG